MASLLAQRRQPPARERSPASVARAPHGAVRDTRAFAALATLLLAAAGLVVRWNVGRQFAFRITDLDQVLMWLSAQEFSRWRFHEPCFWGQDYGSMLEGLLAAPFVRHASFHVLLPWTTSLLAFLPFCLFAIAALHNARPLGAALALLVPLLLPLRFDLLTSLPRAFVPGPAVAAIGIFLFERAGRAAGREDAAATDTRRRRRAACFFGLFSVLGVALNPATVLLVGPACLFFAGRRHAVRGMLAGAVVGSAWPLFCWWFYRVRHPDYVLYPSVADQPFELGLLLTSLADPRPFLADVTPAPFSALRWGALWCSLALGVLLVWSRQRRLALSLLAGLTGTMLLLAHPRTRVGVHSILYSHSRFFIAWPYLLAFASSYVEAPGDWPEARRRVAIAGAVLAGILLAAARQAHLPGLVDAEWRLAWSAPVAPVAVDELYQELEHIERAMRRVRVRPIVFWDLSRVSALAFVAHHPRMIDAFVFHDRRKWFWDAHRHAIYPRVAFYGFPAGVADRARALGHDVRALRANDSFFVVRNNAYTMEQLTETLGLPMLGAH